MRFAKRFLPWIFSFLLVMTSVLAIPLQADASNESPVTRLSGDTRTLTAAKISQTGWPSGSSYVVLARGDQFPDALAGAVLAQAYNAPILLTKSDTLNPETMAEIKRLEAHTIFILGGTGAISQKIEDEFNRDVADFNVVRIDGVNRYETSANIAKYLQAHNKLQTKSAVIAYGQNFPDALAISSWAAQNGVPILLSQTDDLPVETAKAIEELGIEKTFISGETGVISSKVEALLPDPTRYGGNNRYETAVAILNGLGQDTDTLYVATGNDFPDALAGAALAAKEGKGILLVGKTMDPAVKEFLTSKTEKINEVIALGGDGAVSTSILKQISDLLTGKYTETPEQAVNNAFTALKALDEVTVEKYFNDENFFEDEEGTSDSGFSEELSQLFYAKLDYKILSSSISGDTAIVTTKITNTDMSIIFGEYMLEMIGLAFEEAYKPEEEQMSDEEFDQKAEEILYGLLTRDDNPTVTNTVDVRLTKSGNTWIIAEDEELLDALTGGLISVLNEWSEIEE